MPDRVSSCILLLTLFMFLLALTPAADLEGIAAQASTVVSEPEKRGMLVAGIPHAPIAIDGDANFSDTALLEGWPGNGFPESPFIIDGLDIDLGGGEGYSISINNTRVSFIISNCNLTGAEFGICLENVANGVLVNNTCNNNWGGITLFESDHNTVANNMCTSNYQGITLTSSNSNTVTDNTCNSNGKEENPWKMGEGISLYGESDSNTVTDNTCNSNDQGIVLNDSDSNTLANNTCNSNDVVGIEFEYECNHNTVANNTCNSNEYAGIDLIGYSNTATNNTCSSNGSGVLLGGDSNTVTNNTCNDNHAGIHLINSFGSDVTGNICNYNLWWGIKSLNSEYNWIHENICNSNGEDGIHLQLSDYNTVANNTCSNNRIGIFLDESYSNTVVNNTCLGNTEHDILEEFAPEASAPEERYPGEFDNEESVAGGFDPVVLLLIVLVGITSLGAEWRMAGRAARWAEERQRIALEKSSRDDIIIPAGYRIVSWFRMRRALKHVDVEETLEADSSEQ